MLSYFDPGNLTTAFISRIKELKTKLPTHYILIKLTGFKAH